jgi:hypothetical protein
MVDELEGEIVDDLGALRSETGDAAAALHLTLACQTLLADAHVLEMRLDKPLAHTKTGYANPAPSACVAP